MTTNPDHIGDELDDVLGILRSLEREDLTEWESDFVSSLMDKLERFGERAFYSSNQADVMDRLKEKYGV